MTPEKFVDFYKTLVEEEVKIFTDKGREYSGNNNRFNNFQRLGQELELPPEKILWIYLKKHLDSILSYINLEKELSSEPIIGRINDARNYLALLAGMIQEKQGGSK